MKLICEALAGAALAAIFTLLICMAIDYAIPSEMAHREARTQESFNAVAWGK